MANLANIANMVMLGDLGHVGDLGHLDLGEALDPQQPLSNDMGNVFLPSGSATHPIRFCCRI
jgi:hypothetical protein